MSHPYRQAQFAFSANKMNQLAEDALIEIAFAGRSNSGKSSAINTLTGKTMLARVSKTPGRTQLINYFSLPTQGHYLVDLPGYGYAKVPEDMRKHWEKLLGDYLMKRPVLKGAVIMMDVRHPLKDLDVMMIECCLSRHLPVHILLTKSDKLAKQALAKQLASVKKTLANRWKREDISVQTFSSLKKQGVESLVARLDEWYYAPEC